MLMRLQKYLSDAGVASRRKAEEMILSGRVLVNEEVVTTLGTKVLSETDVVCVDGKPVNQFTPCMYVMLHKPIGYITTASDEHGRKTVLDLVCALGVRLHSIGRLDAQTSGLLLLTNNGEATFKLTHPKHHVEKVYVATVLGRPTMKDIEQLQNGIEIDGYITKPAKVFMQKATEKESVLQIAICEGKNRQVRKMFAKIGHNVLHLKRISIGDIQLGDLPVGSYRQLTPKEINYINQVINNA